MSSFWSRSVWAFFHTFAEKINKPFFLEKRLQCFRIIENICANLPCPISRKHSMQYVKRNLKKVQTKDELKLFFFNFHNSVNRRLKKRTFEVQNLKIYKTNNLIQISILMASRIKYYEKNNIFRRNQNYFQLLISSLRKRKHLFI